MVILSKGSKPDNLELHNSQKLSFRNIWVIHLNFVDFKSFLESNSLDILALLRQTWMTQLILAISLWGVLSFLSLKRFYCSYAWSGSLCEGRTSFCTGLVSRKFCRLLLKFLTGFTSLSVLHLFPLSIIFWSLCTFFYPISSNIDEVLLIHLSTNLFVFVCFINIHHKDWLTYSGGVVLVHDTYSKDSQPNNAWFMHKLSINRLAWGIQSTAHWKVITFYWIIQIGLNPLLVKL